MTLRDFQAALASSSPTPGGGTAAAVSLGQAASLTIMVCDLTLGKDRWREGWPSAEAAQTVAIPILHKAGQLAVDDSDAFDAVMDAYGLAKETDEQKQARRAAIRKATVVAAEVPYRTAQLSMDLMHVLEALASSGNANAVTDVGVAALLASAAGKGALFNVEINLQGLPDDHGVDLREALPQLKENMRLTSRKIMDAVRERMNE